MFDVWVGAVVVEGRMSTLTTMEWAKRLLFPNFIKVFTHLTLMQEKTLEDAHSVVKELKVWRVKILLFMLLMLLFTM